MPACDECQRDFQWYLPRADNCAIHTDSTENDVSPGGVKRGHDAAFEDLSWIQEFHNLEHHGTDQGEESVPSKSIRRDPQTYVEDGSSITAGHGGARATAALTTETSAWTDEHLFMQPSGEALSRIQHLTRELDEIKNLLPLLVATSTQRKAVSRLVERFLPRQSTLCVPVSSPLPILASRKSMGSASARVPSSTHDYQSMNSSWRSITTNSSPHAGPSQSPQVYAGSLPSPVTRSDTQDLRQKDLAAHGRSYIEIFGNLDLSTALGTSHHPQYVNMQIQQHSVSSLWLADREIEDAEERRVNSAFNRMRDRSRAQIAWGVPQEAVFGLAYPALLFASEGYSAANMDDALTLSDWVARLLDQYPHTCQDFPTRVGSWVLMFALFKWHVNPTLETWQRVPGWLRPLPVQTLCPHLPALDFLAWPQVRERILCSAQVSLPLINAHTLLEWPFPHESMVTQDETTQSPRISSKFESWCFELPHWHVDSSVEVELPELAGLMSPM